jgi:hypothetical protein
MTRQLTKAEYMNTMTGSMLDVTDSANPLTNIWDYVSKLVEETIVMKYVLDNNIIEKVYRNPAKSFDHVLLPTGNENIFIVIIVDLYNPSIYGHYMLDLNKEYGLN